MLRTELVDLMMQLVSYPELLIVLRVVKHSLIYMGLLQFVHHFHLIEVDQCSIRCPAWDVRHHIRLDADFHLDELFVEWNAEVEPRL